YRFPARNAEGGVRSESDELLELHLTSPANTREVQYQATGIVRAPQANGELSSASHSALRVPSWLEGGSVRIRSLATGLVDEAFLDDRGSFAQDVELRPETDNAMELIVCDSSGQEIARVLTTVRHQSEARHLGQAVLPTQLITKPLQIEVLNQRRQ